MNDPPTLPPPAAGHLRPSARRYRRSSSQSPTRQRIFDDLLVHLTPRTAVKALDGPLKACLDTASTSEQAFAMRTAVASQKIQEWLDELSEWPWPAGGGSGGFEAPAPKPRKASGSETLQPGVTEPGETYIGSLLTELLARYESRVDDIHYEMGELNVEEIKSHVLHNHIMPLSRPGTPMSDSNRSLASSVGSYNRMEDLTAIITAIVMQALPNLSRLIRLMNVWSTRLTVLRRIPSLLSAISDAEIALQSGWNAISMPSQRAADNVAPGNDDQQADKDADSSLTRKDFDVMKLVLEKKVAKPGRMLDFMLDSLEGLEDTLPEEWLDRMEAVETGYGEWAAACEHNLAETEWAKAARAKETAQLAEPPAETPAQEQDREEASSPAIQNGHPTVEQDSNTVTFEEVNRVEEQGQVEKGTREAQTETIDHLEISKAIGVAQETNGGATLTSSSSPPAIPPNVSSSDGPASAEAQARPEDVRQTPTIAIEPSPEDPPTPDLSKSNGEASTSHVTRAIKVENDIIPEDVATQTRIIASIEEDEEEEPSLPPLPNLSRRASDASNTSTIVHGPSSRSAAVSTDGPEQSASPELPRLRDAEEPCRGETTSPPSSPPIRAAKARASSVTFSGGPMVTVIPEDELIPHSPLDASFTEDDLDETRSDLGSPSKRVMSPHDDQLQQQISEILESIPANIKLSSEPATPNLNPPDLVLPRLKRAARDPVRRSQSSLSSRGPTPSFTLAPAYAKNPRPRFSRGNQEIKVYQLSRSTGEAPIKLLIRLVGEQGERVMVRVGGGWADLGEYLKEYATHHGRRSKGADTSKVEIRDLPHVSTSRATTASPPSRPASALDYSPMTPLNVRKTRRSVGPHDEAGSSASKAAAAPKTPASATATTAAHQQHGGSDNTPSSGASTRSRSSSRLSWTEEEGSLLGLAGPTGKKVEMSEESWAWVESVKEKVRLASGEHKATEGLDGRFGDISKVGGTKRVFRKAA